MLVAGGDVEIAASAHRKLADRRGRVLGASGTAPRSSSALWRRESDLPVEESIWQPRSRRAALQPGQDRDRHLKPEVRSAKEAGFHRRAVAFAGRAIRQAWMVS